MSKPRLPKWLMVVRESVSAYEREILVNGKCSKSSDCAELLRERLGRQGFESMVVICLDGQNRVMGLTEVARGGLHGCSVSARDILRVACAIGASGIILSHNHPSGDPTPSPEDIAMTKKVAEACEVVGIPLVDHVIIAGSRHSSFCDLGIL